MPGLTAGPNRLILALLALLGWTGIALAAAPAPSPLIAAKKPAQWVFMFKLNAATFPSMEPLSERSCPFGGTPQSDQSSQQYAFASSDDPQLRPGTGLLGTSDADPLGATFAQIYAGKLHYVIWNDQFDGHPKIPACGDNCALPWGLRRGCSRGTTAAKGWCCR